MKLLKRLDQENFNWVSEPVLRFFEYMLVAFLIPVDQNGFFIATLLKSWSLNVIFSSSSRFSIKIKTDTNYGQTLNFFRPVTYQNC